MGCVLVQFVQLEVVSGVGSFSNIRRLEVRCMIVMGCVVYRGQRCVASQRVVVASQVAIIAAPEENMSVSDS